MNEQYIYIYIYIHKTIYIYIYIYIYSVCVYDMGGEEQSLGGAARLTLHRSHTGLFRLMRVSPCRGLP